MLETYGRIFCAFNGFHKKGFIKKRHQGRSLLSFFYDPIVLVGMERNEMDQFYGIYSDRGSLVLVRISV